MSTNRKLFLHNIVSSFFFCGYFWVAPGTVASLATLLISSLQFVKGFDFPYLIPSVLLVFSVSFGAVAVKNSLNETSERDPGWVVIDEVAGQSVALLIVPQTLLFYAAAFVGFRFFDILKPFPIKNLEKLNGYVGVFADDIAAGIFAGLVIRVIMIFL